MIALEFMDDEVTPQAKEVWNIRPSPMRDNHHEC